MSSRSHQPSSWKLESSFFSQALSTWEILQDYKKKNKSKTQSRALPTAVKRKGIVQTGKWPPAVTWHLN